MGNELSKTQTDHETIRIIYLSADKLMKPLDLRRKVLVRNLLKKAQHDVQRRVQGGLELRYRSENVG